MRYRLRTLLIVLALGLAIVAWRYWPVARETLEPTKQSDQSAALMPSDEPVAEPEPDPCRDFPERDFESSHYVRAYLKFNGIETSTLPWVGMRFDEFVNILGEPTSRWKRTEDDDVENPMGDWAQWFHNPRGMHVAPFISVRIKNGVVICLYANRTGGVSP
jgi:hypothetical protein